MKRLIFLLLAAVSLQATAKSVINDPQVKTLQVVVNQDWLSPPVMKLGSSDVLNIGFD